MIETNQAQNQNQNQKRTIGDLIAYVSPRDFTRIVRPTMNEKIAEMKPALL